MMRVRVDYKKENFFIFLSSLDMIRYFERALRRSGLPILFTSGFSPKPKIDFSLALPLGIQSESEIFDFYLTEKFQEEEILEKLINSIDKNLIINRIKEVKLNSPSISSLITHFQLEINFNEKNNFKIKDFVLKKEKNNEKKLIELKNFIYKEEDEENKKIFIISKDVSLRELYNNLKEFFQENFSIKKLKNLRISNESVDDVFDLD
jgi:radical SAM-linked protein